MYQTIHKRTIQQRNTPFIHCSHRTHGILIIQILKDKAGIPEQNIQGMAGMPGSGGTGL